MSSFISACSRCTCRFLLKGRGPTAAAAASGCTGPLRTLTKQSSSEINKSSKNYSRPFRIIGSPVSPTSETFRKSSDTTLAAQQRYADALLASKKGGGDKAVERHVKVSKKLLPIDRLKRLVDDDSDFLEIGSIAGMGMPYGDVPSAGLTIAIATVCGQRCMVLINDGTVKGGTVYPITVKKQLRAQEIARDLGLPCIYFVDSGGAFLPLQSDIFPDKEHGGRVFFNEAVMSADGIPQIAVVCGNCTAGGAYVPTMACEAVIVDKIGTIYLGGPPLVRAALGEIVSAEELGGATLHCRTSGNTDYFAKSEEEAIDVCRDIVATLNLPAALGQAGPAAFDEPLHSCGDLPGLLPNLQPAHADVMYQIIARLVDGSRFHEFKALYGPTLITGFAFVHGRLVGLVANNGRLCAAAAEKGAHFVQLCVQRNVPITFLVHAEDSALASADVLTSHSKMMAAIACSAVPKFTFYIGDCFGFTASAMCSRAMGATLVFAWPTSRLAFMEPAAMAESAAAAQEPDVERRAILSDKLRQQFNREADAMFGASRLWTDGVVFPEDTREVLGKCLNIVAECNWSTKIKHLQPVYRM